MKTQIVEAASRVTPPEVGQLFSNPGENLVWLRIEGGSGTTGQCVVLSAPDNLGLGRPYPFDLNAKRVLLQPVGGTLQLEEVVVRQNEVRQ